MRYALISVTSLGCIVIAVIQTLAQGPPRGTPVFGTGRAAPGITINSVVPEINGTTRIQDGQYRISNARPLDVAATLLARKLGVPVSYEEAAWLFSGDMNGNSPPAPRAETLDVILSTHLVSPADVIQMAIDAHHNRHNIGEFRLAEFGENEFSIVIDKASDESGKLVPRRSALDTRISFPGEERTVQETINLVLRLAAGSVLQGPGTPPISFQQTKIRMAVTNETARDVLSRIVRIPGEPKRSWHLGVVPSFGGAQTTFFAFEVIRAEVVDARGTVRLETQFWPK